MGQAGFPVPVPPIADLPPGGGLPGEADGGLPGGAGAVVAAVAAGPSWPGDIVVDRFDGRPVDERLVADAYLILGLTPPSANMPASTDDEGADSGRRTDRPAGPDPLGVVKTTKPWKDMTDEEIDALSKKLFNQMKAKLPPAGQE